MARAKVCGGAGTRGSGVVRAACFGAIVLAAAAAALVGCKAEEAKSTGFTDAKLMARDPQLPFQKAWWKPGVDFRKYKKVYVADVNTAYMLKNTTWQNGERQGDIEKDVKYLADYTKVTIEKSLREDPKHRFQVIDAPSNEGDTLAVEVAITEVVPSKVVLNALGYAPFGVGIAITAVRFVAKDQSSAAFEARVRDGASGEVIAMAADRESEQFAPISVRGLTWYSHAKTIIDHWARQGVLVANRKPGETVKPADTFTLQPW
jgi:hypothetical protein